MNTTDTASMSLQQAHQADRPSARGRDDVLYRAAFAISFPLFLVGVMVTRLFTTGDHQQGVLAEALASAHSSIAIALKD